MFSLSTIFVVSIFASFIRAERDRGDRNLWDMRAEQDLEMIEAGFELASGLFVIQNWILNAVQFLNLNNI